MTFLDRLRENRQEYDEQQERLARMAREAQPSSAIEPPTEMQPKTPQTVVLPPEKAGRTDTTHRTSLQEARARIRTAIEKYLADPWPDHMLLIKAAPGVGKTYAGVTTAEAEALAGKRVLYAGPRHDFYNDIKAIAQQPQLWYEWLPRQLATDDKPETCRYGVQIDKWMKKGYNGETFCEKVCGFDYMNHACPYHQQKGRPEHIVYGHHLHVLAHPLMKKFQLIIGDEDPQEAFLWEWDIDHKFVAPTGMNPTEDLTHMLWQLSGMCGSHKGKSLEGRALMDALGGPDRVLEAIKDYVVENFELEPPKIRKADEVENVGTGHLLYLAGLLQREAEAYKTGQDYLSRVLVVEGKLKLLMRKPTDPTKMPPHVIWLDATGVPEIYEQLFDRKVTVVDATPALDHVAIYQITDRMNGKMMFEKEGKGGERRMNKHVDEALAQIEIIRDWRKSETDPGYQRPAVITFMNLEQRIAGVDTLHFYGNRGTNVLQNNDCLIILGTPQPNKDALTMKARMIFFKRMAAWQGEWANSEQAYEYVNPETGEGMAREVGGYWDDPDLRAVQYSTREAEIVQAAHRIRPVTRTPGNRADIWLLTNLPVAGLPPTRFYTLEDLYGVPEGVREMPEKITPFFFYRIMKAVRQLMNNERPVTPPMVAEHLGIDRKTVAKVFDKLEPADGKWVRVGTGGRPTWGWIKSDPTDK